jgi:hypothetical protein
VLLAAERSLEFYDGVALALAEAWMEWDKRAEAAADDEEYWLSRIDANARN